MDKVMAIYLNVRDLYDLWSNAYDSYPNPLIELEQKIVPGMAGDVKGKRLLDIGCGTGRYADWFSGKGADVTGVDFCRSMLDIARKKNPRMDLVQAEIGHIPLAGRFDIVLCNLVLGHVSDLDAAMSEIAGCTKPGGCIIISDLRTGFGFKKNKVFRIFKNFSTNSYRHTLGDYYSAFQANHLELRDFKNLVFDLHLARKHKRIFYLMGLTIGYAFKLEKAGASI
jgi:SAM-dependent methyltransferase